MNSFSLIIRAFITRQVQLTVEYCQPRNLSPSQTTSGHNTGRPKKLNLEPTRYEIIPSKTQANDSTLSPDNHLDGFSKSPRGVEPGCETSIAGTNGVLCRISPTSTPRWSRRVLAVSRSVTTRQTLRSDPTGVSVTPLPNWIEQLEPGGE